MGKMLLLSFENSEDDVISEILSICLLYTSDAADD